jgi:hypothetical protein
MWYGTTPKMVNLVSHHKGISGNCYASRKLWKGETQKMKKMKIVCWLLVLVVIVACSEKNSKPQDVLLLPPALSTTPCHTISITDPIADMSIFTLTQIRYETDDSLTTAISLEQFITTTLTIGEIAIPRALFSFNQIASDGFSPRNPSTFRGDLLWDEFAAGYLLPHRGFRSYFPDKNIGAYNVRNIRDFHLHRSIIIVKANGDSVLFQTSALEKTEIELSSHQVEAIKLTDFITPFVTETPTNYQYLIEGVDGANFPLTWTQLQAGYFVISTDRFEYPSISIAGAARMRNPMKISLYTP